MFKKSTVFILHFTPACVLLSVCSLHFTHSLHFTPGLQSAVRSLRFTLTEFKIHCSRSGSRFCSIYREREIVSIRILRQSWDE